MAPKAAAAPTKGRGGPTTAREVEAWKQQMKAELSSVRTQTEKAIAEIGNLYVPNSYFSFYKTKGSNTHSELDYTIDKIHDESTFDQKAKRDTYHPRHKRLVNGLQTSQPVTSSQIYGWYRVIDFPKYGFERSQLCKTSFQDSSHLGKSRLAGLPAPANPGR
jgi:hypothetical protein